MNKHTDTQRNIDGQIETETETETRKDNRVTMWKNTVRWSMIEYANPREYE